MTENVLVTNVIDDLITLKNLINATIAFYKTFECTI